jgi:hypothetical protein
MNSCAPESWASLTTVPRSQLLDHPAGTMLSDLSGQGGVQNGQVTNLPLLGSITTYVDPNNQTLYNVTNPDHTLYPGLVERSVGLGNDGLYHINTYGEGNGIAPGINDNLSGVIFGGRSVWMH